MHQLRIMFVAATMAVTLAFSGPAPVRAVGATTHWVAISGTASGTGSSCSDPGYVGDTQEPIIAALAAAQEGDTVHICAGEYVYTANGYNDTLPDRITILGDGAGKTILNGDDTYYLLAIYDTDGLRVSNLTLTRGSDSYGAALYLGDSHAVVSGVEFVENSASHAGADYGGAALYVQDSSTVSVVGCRFEGNIAPGTSAGGAINIYTGANEESHVTVTSSTFIGNRAGQGPAIYSYDDDELDGPVSTLTLRNNVFRENENLSSDDGGALAHEHTNADLTLVSNLFVGNIGAAYGGAAEIWDVTGAIVVERNTFRANAALEGGALWIDVSGGTRHLSRNTFISNVAGLGGALAFECESGVAARVASAITAQNRFSLNRATESRRTANVFASDYGCD